MTMPATTTMTMMKNASQSVSQSVVIGVPFAELALLEAVVLVEVS